jgi:beta-lactamase class A
VPRLDKPDWIRLARAIPAGRVGVSLKLLEAKSTFSWHGDHDFPAASVIKIPIMMELYRQAAMGVLSLDKQIALQDTDKVAGGVLSQLHAGLELSLEDLCRLMIIASDNTASNLLLDRVKMPAVNELMDHLQMRGSHLGRRFMEPPTPERDNRMTADDAVLCLEAIHGGALLGERSSSAVATLQSQLFREKIPALLPSDVKVGNKTGELEGVRHDAALIELPGRTYALAVFTAEGTDDALTDRGIAELSLAIYLDLKEDLGGREERPDGNPST